MSTADSYDVHAAMESIQEELEDYLWDIAGENSSEDHYDEIGMMEPGLLKLKPENVLKIIEIIGHNAKLALEQEAKK